MTSEQFKKYMKEKYGSTIKFEKIKLDPKLLAEFEKEVSAQIETNDLIRRKSWIEKV